MTYRLHFICPRCSKQSATTQLHSWPLPDLKCDDCLVDEVIPMSVPMKCVGVQRIFSREEKMLPASDVG
jgi:hypothetical protein